MIAWWLYSGKIAAQWCSLSIAIRNNSSGVRSVSLSVITPAGAWRLVQEEALAVRGWVQARPLLGSGPAVDRSDLTWDVHADRGVGVGLGPSRWPLPGHTRLASMGGSDEVCAWVGIRTGVSACRMDLARVMIAGEKAWRKPSSKSNQKHEARLVIG